MTCAEQKPRLLGRLGVARKQNMLSVCSADLYDIGRMPGHVPWGKARWLGGVLRANMASAAVGPATVIAHTFNNVLVFMFGS